MLKWVELCVAWACPNAGSKTRPRTHTVTRGAKCIVGSGLVCGPDGLPVPCQRSSDIRIEVFVALGPGLPIIFLVSKVYCGTARLRNLLRQKENYASVVPH